MEAYAQTHTPPELTAALPDIPWTPLVAVSLLAYVTYRVFSPYIRWKLVQLSNARKHWAFRALVGRKMSERAKNIQIAEEFHSALLNLVTKGVITHKDKRARIRQIEAWLFLDPGTIGARPHKEEIKRKIRGRLKTRIHSMTARMSQANGQDKVVQLKPTSASARLKGVMSKR